MNIIKEILGLFRRNTIVTPEDSDVLIVGKRKPGNSKTPQVNDALVTFKSIKDSIGVDATNTGAGEEVLKTPVVGNSLKFRTLRAGSNITLTQNADDIQIDAAGGGGAIGIADATGTYTYYSKLNDAIIAATPGQVVELFADIEETTATSVNLRGGVDINFNGHSYTLNETTGVPNVFNTDLMSDGDEVHMWNGKINRIGSLNFTTGTNYDENRIIASNSKILIYWHDCVLECDNGGFIYASAGSFYGGTYLNFHLTATASWGLIHTSTGGTALFYDFRMMSKKMMNLKNYGGKFYNCSFYNETYIVCGLYNGAAELHNCYAESDGHSALIGSNGYAYNSYFKASATQPTIVFPGTCWNCLSIGSGGAAISVNSSNSKAFNCTGKSATNYGLTMSSAGTIRGGHYESGSSLGGRLTGQYYNAFVNITFVGGSNGDAVQIGNNTRLADCTLVVTNTSKNAINGLSGFAASAYYGNNTIVGSPTTPINALVTQAQTTAQDTFGNIVLD
jgi:hypothetical protein